MLSVVTLIIVSRSGLSVSTVNGFEFRVCRAEYCARAPSCRVPRGKLRLSRQQPQSLVHRRARDHRFKPRCGWTAHSVATVPLSPPTLRSFGKPGKPPHCQAIAVGHRAHFEFFDISSPWRSAMLPKLQRYRSDNYAETEEGLLGTRHECFRFSCYDSRTNFRRSGSMFVQRESDASIAVFVY
jgi:hypothetical protein